MFFFFQAEDGIRDKLVTGVQTCALPISAPPPVSRPPPRAPPWLGGSPHAAPPGSAAAARTRRYGPRAAWERCPTRRPQAGAWRPAASRAPPGPAPPGPTRGRPPPARRGAPPPPPPPF